MSDRLRIVVGAIVAPLVPGVLWGLYEGWRWERWSTVLESASFGAAVFWIAMILLALPILLMLRRTGRTDIWRCMLAGAFGGAALTAVLVAITVAYTGFGESDYDHSLSSIVFDIALFALLGATMGAVFKLIAFSGRPADIPSTRSPASSP